MWNQGFLMKMWYHEMAKQIRWVGAELTFGRRGATRVQFSWGWLGERLVFIRSIKRLCERFEIFLSWKWQWWNRAFTNVPSKKADFSLIIELESKSWSPRCSCSYKAELGKVLQVPSTWNTEFQKVFEVSSTWNTF